MPQPRSVLVLLFLWTWLLYAVPVWGANADPIEEGVATLANNLVRALDQSGVKKISVMDLTDLQGRNLEFGRFFAEQLSVTFVLGNKNFAVLDRANLRLVLEEQKLTASGLLDPAKAHILRDAAGVDAIVIGTITIFDTVISVTAKAISTNTTEVIAAARVNIDRNKNINTLITSPLPVAISNVPAPTMPATPPPSIAAPPAPTTPADPKAREFDGILVRLDHFRSAGANKLTATFTITGGGKYAEQLVAIEDPPNAELGCVATSSRGLEYRCYQSSFTSIPHMAMWVARRGGQNWREMLRLEAGERRTFTIPLQQRGAPDRNAPNTSTGWSIQLSLIVVADGRLKGQTLVWDDLGFY